MTDGENLSLKSVSFRAGGNEILKKISLSFQPGQMTAIIGPSGSGKSTLLKCLTTTIEPSDGRATLGALNLAEIREDFRQQLGYVPQDDVIHRELSVESAFYYSARLRLSPALTEDDVQNRINELAGLLGLADRKNHKISKLSGGQRKRVALAQALISEPDLLILDEPTNHLDLDMIEWLESYLLNEKLSILMVTHDRYFLDRICDTIIELEDGKLFRYKGNFFFWVENLAPYRFSALSVRM